MKNIKELDQTELFKLAESINNFNVILRRKVILESTLQSLSTTNLQCKKVVEEELNGYRKLLDGVAKAIEEDYGIFLKTVW